MIRRTKTYIIRPRRAGFCLFAGALHNVVLWLHSRSDKVKKGRISAKASLSKFVLSALLQPFPRGSRTIIS